MSRLPAIDRIFGKVAIVGECWIFTGSTTGDGYAQVKVNGRVRYAHRVAYENAFGAIPSGLTIDHVKARGCTSRACVNPAHLEAISSGQSALRGDGPPAINARRVVCSRGHELTQGVDQRRCLTCKRDANRRSAERRRAKSAVVRYLHNEMAAAPTASVPS